MWSAPRHPLLEANCYTQATDMLPFSPSLNGSLGFREKEERLSFRYVFAIPPKEMTCHSKLTSFSPRLPCNGRESRMDKRSSSLPPHLGARQCFTGRGWGPERPFPSPQSTLSAPLREKGETWQAERAGSSGGSGGIVSTASTIVAAAFTGLARSSAPYRPPSVPPPPHHPFSFYRPLKNEIAP